MVAFPVYLLTQRLIAREIAPIRKWLTYIALLIAAGIVIGDLIAFVSYFLSGELTMRFVLKVATVLLIAGGVFWYYLGSLRPARAGARLFLAAACGMVALALVVGFGKLGSPADQRLIEADRQRAEDLLRVAGDVNEYWKAKGELPPRIDGPYDYRILGGSRYELCAAFATVGTDGRNRFLAHPRGRHCFTLDAALPVSSLRP